MLNVFIGQMNRFTDKLMTGIDEESLQETMENFQDWQDSRNKHEVIRYYSDVHFGIYYTKRLFRSRVECFHEVLVNVSLVSEVKTLMMENLDVTSFGCGPGPEIAAYMSFMRNQCCVQGRLSFLAVDKIPYWREFVKVTGQLDGNVSIKFDNAELNISYLNRINPGGVCIMSYPESVNFGDIWAAMKRYFQLIILVDQSKYQLHNNLRYADFTILPFHYKGSKHCAYYVAPIPVVQPRRTMSITTIPTTRQINSNEIPIKKEDKPIPRIINNTPIPISNNSTTRPISPGYTAAPRRTDSFTRSGNTDRSTIPKSVNNITIQPRSFNSTNRPISPEYTATPRSTDSSTRSGSTDRSTIPKSVNNITIQPKSFNSTNRPISPSSSSITKLGSPFNTAIPTNTTSIIQSQRTNDINRLKHTNRVPSAISETQNLNKIHKFPNATENEVEPTCCKCTIL